MARSSTCRAVPRPVRALTAVLALVLLAGCRADLTVAVRARAEGGGNVSATLSLDEAAAAQVPDLADQLAVGDLKAAGWRIEGPLPAAGGRTVVRAVKPFGSAAEATRALEELTGPGGPFASLRLSRSTSVLETRTSLAGKVDLGAGLASFSDAVVEERLGKGVLAESVARLEAELGKPVGEMLGLRLTADLPGRPQGGTDEVWELRLGESVPVNLVSKQLNLSALGFGSASVVSGVALVIVLLRRRKRA